MFIYTLVVIAVIAVSSALLVYVLKKNNMFKLEILLAIIVSSVAVCFMFPFIYGLMSNLGGFASGQAGELLSVLTALVIYITLILLFSIIASLIFTEEKLKKFFQRVGNIVVEKGYKRFIKLFSRPVGAIEENNNAENGTENIAENDTGKGLDTWPDMGMDTNPLQYVEAQELHDGDKTQEETEKSDFENYSTKGENIFEKSVDTGQNIDKMGLVENSTENSVICADDGGFEQVSDGWSQTVDTQEIDAQEPDLAEFVGVTGTVEATGTAEVAGVSETVEAGGFASADEVVGIPDAATGIPDAAGITEAVVVDEVTEVSEAAEVAEVAETAGKAEVSDAVEAADVAETSGTTEVIGAAGAAETNEAGEFAGLAAFDERDDEAEVREDALPEADFVEEQEKAGRMDSTMNLGIDECIEEAFKLKQNKDIEGAILYYMYALDKEPERDLVFWIILDICALYKSLGKADLAKEILDSYVSTYGDVMDEEVRNEIERNLSYS